QDHPGDGYTPVPDGGPVDAVEGGLAHGSVLISTSPMDSSSTDSAPKNWPRYATAGCPGGPAANHKTAQAPARPSITAGPIHRAGSSTARIMMAPSAGRLCRPAPGHLGC